MERTGPSFSVYTRLVSSTTISARVIRFMIWSHLIKKFRDFIYFRIFILYNIFYKYIFFIFFFFFFTYLTHYNDGTCIFIIVHRIFSFRPLYHFFNIIITYKDQLWNFEFCILKSRNLLWNFDWFKKNVRKLVFFFSKKHTL